ncbi:DivIVA domain-containing protein, partial [Pseudonocardia sp. KRD-184]|uniref:DivIVA domain-containing protein n=1 Tax=Pseudonocardia oceani TaxID=2792013 RepID=UPI001C4A4CCA
MTSDAGVPGAPRFDVVLRGYDRRQVDEHVDRLQRVLARMRADLDVARSQPMPVVSSSQPMRPRPTPRPRPGGPAGDPDTIGTFTDRMESILAAAEEEAAEIRRNAHRAARAETEGVRAQVADLMRQRDAVLAELTRMRSQLEGMLAAPTAQMPAHESANRPVTARRDDVRL